jgi:hypothetical protein
MKQGLTWFTNAINRRGLRRITALLGAPVLAPLRRAHRTYATVLTLCLLAAPTSAAAGAATGAHAEPGSLFSSTVRTAAVHRTSCPPPKCTMPKPAPKRCPGASRVVKVQSGRTTAPSMGRHLLASGLLEGPMAHLPVGTPEPDLGFRLVEGRGVRQWAWAQKIGWDTPPGGPAFTVRGWNLRTGAPIWWQLTPGATRVTTLGIVRLHRPHVLAPDLLYVTSAGCYRLVVHYPGGVRSGVLGIGR